ncbi:MAG TPA: hypothetical protein VIL88_16745 [Devosia sp.]|jgi:Arc/MetJ-type ribon-helix-helix transcriptional regulator|uniref:hypothetical protein n=1 Tax=Devosia sp. TaxID=1871048 RepID=UPI002F93A1D6
MAIDYTARAELYVTKRHARRAPAQYKRFNSASEAIRYCIEELPQQALNGSILEVDEQRFEGLAIQALYLAEGYPLPRLSA